MAALGSLSAIARQRPAFMSIVVQAFESLHGEYHVSFKKVTVIATPAFQEFLSCEKKKHVYSIKNPTLCSQVLTLS